MPRVHEGRVSVLSGACNFEPAVPVAGASRAAVVAPSALETINAGAEGQGMNGQMVATVGPR
eukprot:966021-Prymnesium_polylepis.1